MGIMIIPFVSSLSDDAIRAVPRSLRDGSLAMGATRAETMTRVLLPAALPGIMGGILLALSRAIGETMIVVMAAGLIASMTINPLDSVTTVTVQIVTLLIGDTAFDSPKTLAAFALGLVLFVVTLALNVDRARHRPALPRSTTEAADDRRDRRRRPALRLTDAAAAYRRRRYAADRRLRAYGVGAISLALGLLGAPDRHARHRRLAGLHPDQRPGRLPDLRASSSTRPIPPRATSARSSQEGVAGLLPGEHSPPELRALGDILTDNTQFLVRDAVVRDPALIGGTLTLEVPVADPYDQLNKGLIDRATPEDRRRLDDAEIARFDALEDAGRISRPFNRGLFLNADSRFPEIAGLARRHRRLVLRAARLLPDQLPGRHRRRDLPRGVRAARTASPT